MKQKITHILYSGLGGHGSVIFSILEGDVYKDATQSLLFYGVEPLNPDYRTKLEQDFPEVAYHFVQKKKGMDIYSIWLVFRALVSLAPTTIMLHSMNLILTAFLYARLHHVKLVAIEHTPNQVKTKLEWLWTRLSFRLAKYRVYLTESYKNEIYAKYKGKAIDNCQVIPNGINTTYFTAQNRQFTQYPNKAWKLFMAARFSEQKDQLTLIKAVKKLHKMGISITLSLAGNGPMLQMCKDFVAENNMEQEVTFLGYVQEKVIKLKLQDTDIYVHSSYGETMSTAIMQAMSCGLAIVVTDIIGIRHMVDEDKAGLFFDVEDVDGLVRCVQQLINDNHLRERLGTYSREYALKHFSHIRMFQHYVSIAE